MKMWMHVVLRAAAEHKVRVPLRYPLASIALLADERSVKVPTLNLAADLPDSGLKRIDAAPVAGSHSQ
jgi:hypothetical protein